MRKSLAQKLVKAPALLNRSVDKDVRCTISIIQFYFTPIGFWPNAGPEFVNNAKFLVWLGIVLFTVIPTALFIVFAEKNLIIKLRFMCLASYILIIFVNFLSLSTKRESLRHCVKCVSDDWRNASRSWDYEIMRRYARIGRTVATASAVVMYSSGVFHHVILPLTTKQIVDNATVHLLTYPTYEPFMDGKSSPNFEILYTVHCFFGYLSNTMACSTSGITATFVLHACAQIRILTAKLDELVDGGGSDQVLDVNDRLADIVKHHLRVLKLIFHINEVLREVCLCDLLGSTMLICLLMFCGTLYYKEGDISGVITNLISVLSLWINVFVSCYIGDLLIQQFLQFGNKAYMIEWYRLPKRIASGLILILATANSPPKISGGHITELSLSTFCTVFKTTMTYFNFVQTLVA